MSSDRKGFYVYRRRIRDTAIFEGKNHNMHLTSPGYVNLIGLSTAPILALVAKATKLLRTLSASNILALIVRMT